MNPKIKLLRFLFVAALTPGMAGSSSAQTLKLPPHEKIVLKNGLTVLLMEKPGVPMASLAALVKAGDVSDPTGEEGLSSVTAGLLRKGTAKRSATIRGGPGFYGRGIQRGFRPG